MKGLQVFWKIGVMFKSVFGVGCPVMVDGC